MSYCEKWNAWVAKQATKNRFYSAKVWGREELLSCDFLPGIATKKQIERLKGFNCENVFILIGFRNKPDSEEIAERLLLILPEQKVKKKKSTNSQASIKFPMFPTWLDYERQYDHLYELAWKSYKEKRRKLINNPPRLTPRTYLFLIREELEGQYDGCDRCPHTYRLFSSLEGGLHAFSLLCRKKELDYWELKDKLLSFKWIRLDDSGIEFSTRLKPVEADGDIWDLHFSPKWSNPDDNTTYSPRDAAKSGDGTESSD